MKIAVWLIHCGSDKNSSIRRPGSDATGRSRNPVPQAAGEVEEIGSEVTGFKKGDRVYGLPNFLGGMYAEYITANIQQEYHADLDGHSKQIIISQIEGCCPVIFSMISPRKK